MNRFVAGGVAGLLLVAAGLFWWQGRAERQQVVAPRPVAMATPVESLPEGEDNALGAAPPMPPEAREEDREAKRFGRYDHNRDGIVTRIEMMASRTDDFKKLDKDGNNLLSFEEWAVKTSDRFAGADANRDSKLTRSEFATTAPKPGPKPRCAC
ncbi:MAG: hypothetical protein KA533_01725 [Sphingobium sp.]|nr:hypothetical protein [Sphingobium sp.]MBP6111821.1 hypothetical protein [Sphingobium sp.]MBP8669919.1 hypothetical protein [Sphingobium sp.]MBP9157851.1 hypothetical protein [Sphingobium sp.]